jgi:hypothetical protein
MILNSWVQIQPTADTGIEENDKKTGFKNNFFLPSGETKIMNRNFKRKV